MIGPLRLADERAGLFGWHAAPLQRLHHRLLLTSQTTACNGPDGQADTTAAHDGKGADSRKLARPCITLWQNAYDLIYTIYMTLSPRSITLSIRHYSCDL